MRKSEQIKADVVQLLLEAGFVFDGETASETVRVPTRRSPVFGRSGGELAKFGGRLRLSKTGTDIKVTVGTRTTYLYRSAACGGEAVSEIAYLDTQDFAKVREAVTALEAAQLQQKRDH